MPEFGGGAHLFGRVLGQCIFQPVIDYYQLALFGIGSETTSISPISFPVAKSPRQGCNLARRLLQTSLFNLIWFHGRGRREELYDRYYPHTPASARQ